MNKINKDNSLLLIIDVQDKLVNMLGETDIVKNSSVLAKSATILKIPTIISEQYPKGLGQTINEIKKTTPEAKYFEKTNFSIYLEEGFKEFIKNTGKKQIIILGIETHICVLQTAIDLLNMGYEIFIVEDATGSRASNNKDWALKRLMHAGAQIVTTEMVVFEWLKSSKNPNFKEIQSLIK